MNEITKQKLLNTVKINYEEIAADFSQTRSYVWPELKKIITVNDGDRILDLGCGNGRLFELFKNNDYTGIDQSINLIKIAKKKYPDANFINGNILELDKLTAKKFDIILLIAVLQHIPSDELRLLFLKQAKNHLQPDGKLMITAWDLYARPDFKKKITKFLFLKLLWLNKMDRGDILFSGFNKESRRYYHAFKLKELKKLITDAGLQIEKIYSDKNNIYAICQL
ncbi:MAG: class I SAM-dependent methyltransferase [bacterium]|nr:class I SAM-dependent methyltransferase [bacterium]